MKPNYGDFSFAELARDYRNVKGELKSGDSMKLSINSDDELNSVCAKITNAMKELGMTPDFKGAGFAKLKTGHSGEFSHHTKKLSLNKDYEGKEYSATYGIIAHELVHSTGVRDEVVTELLSLEVCSYMATEDEKFGLAVYGRLFNWITMATDLKARKEKVSKWDKEAVEEILHMPLKRTKMATELYEPDTGAFSDNTYIHDVGDKKCIHTYLNDRDLSIYGFRPLSALKDGIKNGRIVHGKHDFSVENLAKLLEG